jgi:hypothetical protein
MKRKMTVAIALLLAATALLTLSGCKWVKSLTYTGTSTLPLNGATSLTAEIVQSIGELTVSASTAASRTVKADVSYAPESWKPIVTMSANASDAVFRMVSPSDADRFPFGYTHNSWAVKLPTGVMTQLSLELGVGRSVVDLRGIDVNSLSVRTGVGDTSIDLSGARTKDVTVQIVAGVGNLTLRLPRGVGVKVITPERGVGNLSAPGFDQVGETLTNAAYSTTSPQIVIALVRGVGNVTLEVAD